MCVLVLALQDIAAYDMNITIYTAKRYYVYSIKTDSTLLTFIKQITKSVMPELQQCLQQKMQCSKTINIEDEQTSLACCFLALFLLCAGTSGLGGQQLDLSARQDDPFCTQPTVGQSQPKMFVFP